MIKISKLGIKPCAYRIGWVNVQYHEVTMRCNICLYKKEKLYIRMPEVYIKNEKFPFVFWESPKVSANFQKEVLKLLKVSIGLDVAKAVKLKEDWENSNKEIDKNKKSI